MPKRVVIVADVEPSLVRALQNDDRFEVHLRAGDALDTAVRDAEILITRTIIQVTDTTIANAPSLRAIAQGTSGIDNIDIEAAKRANVAVIHLPGVNANAVAELVIGEIIALTRTVTLYDAQMRAGRWDRRDCASRHEMRHYTVGIIGFGNVGSRVARLADAFGMHVFAFDPYVSEFGTATRVATRTELLRLADILTLHVPLTDETRGMIGADELQRLPRGAVVVNASRGEVLDIRAALDALASNHLGGLALDVFDVEPPAIQWPDDPRLIVTPHIAGCTEEAKSTAAQMLYEKLVAWATSH